ncbi:MAG: hypothetical protein ACI8XU_002778, partial [Kiritimatiellia bacterium]
MSGNEAKFLKPNFQITIWIPQWKVLLLAKFALEEKLILRGYSMVEIILFS